jgi:hypothetical protein
MLQFHELYDCRATKSLVTLEAADHKPDCSLCDNRNSTTLDESKLDSICTCMIPIMNCNGKMQMIRTVGVFQIA